MAVAEFVRNLSPFRKPASRKPAGAVVTHACGASLYLALVVAYVVYALYSYFTQPIIETYQAIEAKQFGVMDLHFNISCPTCIPLTSTDVINSTTELFRVWQGYDRVEYPHCAAAPEDEFVADQEVTSAKLCYSSDDISERSGVVVMLWNMTSGGQGHRAEVLVTGPELRVTTPLEFWHEKTLLLGLTVNRDKDGCVSAKDCNLRRELYLASMQYDGRVSGWPGARLNLRMMRSAHVYTRAPGQSIWDVLGAVGGFSGLMMSVIAFSVHALERFEDPATSAGLEVPSGTIEEEKEGFPTDATISGMAGFDA